MTENDLRLEFKKSTGKDALEFDSTLQTVEIETRELQDLSVLELEDGRVIEVKGKFYITDFELKYSFPYLSWLEEKLIELKKQ